MRGLLSDARYAFRSLSRSPGFTIVATLLLGFGIGANSAVFSLANALFLRPLPVTDPDSAIRVFSNRYSNTPYATYLELVARNSTLSGLAASQISMFGMRAGGDPEQAFGALTTGNYFPLLGVRPEHGRVLTESDDSGGAESVAVLSHAFWSRRFGRDPSVVGTTITLNDRPFTIVGIVEAAFTGVTAPLTMDLWVPMAADEWLRPGLSDAERIDSRSVHLMGRLRPGIDRTRAQADLDTIGRQLRIERGVPDDRPAVSVYGASVLPPEFSSTVLAFSGVLLALVALVLFLVCSNLASLVLTRASGRGSELAVRQALGASRARLVRQLLAEPLLLAIAGAIAGLAVAYSSVRLLTAVPLPTTYPMSLDVSVDMRVVAFTMAIAIAAMLAVGAMPAWRVSRVDLVRMARGAGEESGHRRMRSMLLVAQVSLSVLLLIVAGLLIRSLGYVRTLDLGLDANGVVTASVDLETRGDSAPRGEEFVRSARRALEAQQGIASAHVVDIVPLTLSNSTILLLRDGDVRPSPGDEPPIPPVRRNAVGPGHFETLHIPIVEGRDFSALDVDGATRVAIVNETMARRFWPGESALGQRLWPANSSRAPGDALEIVGVARDSKYVTVGEEPGPFLYQPLAQAYTPIVTFVVRAADPASPILQTVTRTIREMDPGLAMFNTGPLQDAMSVSLLPVRLTGMLLSGLGALALVLSALGIYGGLSFVVYARTREIGLRTALGATPGSVAGFVIGQAMKWVATGTAIGALLAILTTRLLASLLYGVSPTDPLTFASVIGILGGVALAAAALPAIRASRLDPLVALRQL